jgi:hypothetical protein
MLAITRNAGIKLDATKSGIELVKLNPARSEVLNIKKLIHWQNAKRLDSTSPDAAQKTTAARLGSVFIPIRSVFKKILNS